MNDTQANTLWEKLSDLKARLRDHVRIHRHRYRGKLWYVLQDRSTTQYYRFGSDAYDIVRLMDGERSLKTIDELLSTREGEDPGRRERLVTLVAQLHESELLQCDGPSDMASLLVRQRRAKPSVWKHFLRSPFLIRLNLLDPEPALNRLQKFTRHLFGWAGFLMWFAVVATATVMAVAYWPEIGAYWASRELAPNDLLIILMTYPAVKGVHEFAHAAAVKRWGGQVREMGVMLIMLLPIPYVDASAASSFRDKHRRIVVGAAGILAELFLAALATIVWFTVETGMTRDIAFNVMLIGSVSTLFFNGNPLLRFDGYYVLADAIEIPNLAPRSVHYYAYLLKRYLLGLKEAVSPVSARGERIWFLAYGVSSSVYRIVVLLTIVAYVVDQLLILGVILGAIAITSQLLLPLGRQLDFLIRSPALAGRRVRALSTAIIVSGSLGAGLFLVPVSSSTYAQGIVWLPEHAQVRAGSDGFLQAVVAPGNTNVHEGDLLFRIDDPLLAARLRSLEWERRELEARYDAAMVGDRSTVRTLKQQIARASKEIAQAREHYQDQWVTSRASGLFIAPRAQHLNGRFVHRGDVLGYVADLSTPVIRTVLDQDRVDQVRSHTTRVEVKLADASDETLSGTIAHEVPSATTRLPSAALGTPGGGPIAVRPDDPQGLQTVDQIFLLDVALADAQTVDRVGSRVHLRFIHNDEPLAEQWMRTLRQLFLRRFTV